MITTFKRKLGLAILTLALPLVSQAQNPIVRDQFTADPTARVFGDKVYLFPSHDIPTPPNQGLRKDWFCMADYHVFSSGNLTDWTDHGMIVSQNTVPWAKKNAYSMWAPDCAYRNGKYYFYFPTAPDSTYGRGFSIGVAVADKPEGPYIPEPKPIAKVRGIDPNVFIDKDGQAYIYWSMGNIFGAKLKENMLEIEGEPVVLKDLPTKGMKEGPFLFERNGIYYLTFPHVADKVTERLEYGMGKSPLGPFTMTGVIMDEHPSGCWTNHHSFINFKDQWYLFYHHNDLSPNFDKLRSARIDSMFFNADGTIQLVKPTLRGVGLTSAAKQIQLDRYTSISDKGASIAFLDTTNRFAGWKTRLEAKEAWIKYNAVDFSAKKYKTLKVYAASETGGTLELRLDKADGTLVAKISVPKGAAFAEVTAKVAASLKGAQNLVLVSKEDKPVEIDWISFE
jgi:hypothetical protein